MAELPNLKWKFGGKDDGGEQPRNQMGDLDKNTAVWEVKTEKRKKKTHALRAPRHGGLPLPVLKSERREKNARKIGRKDKG